MNIYTFSLNRFRSINTVNNIYNKVIFTSKEDYMNYNPLTSQLISK